MNANDASAGSKIFVGGLDRSVDEGIPYPKFRRQPSIHLLYKNPYFPFSLPGVVRSFFQQFGPVVEVRQLQRGSRRLRRARFDEAACVGESRAIILRVLFIFVLHRELLRSFVHTLRPSSAGSGHA